MKFSQIAKGTKARRPFSFPLIDGQIATCAIVPLLGEDDSVVLQRAREYARSHGVEDPKDGDPLYERGLWAHTLLLACVDSDSPESAPAPFFDGGIAQLLDPKCGLDRDRLALLFEACESWRDECAPRPGAMTGSQFISQVLAHAIGEDRNDLPFEGWRPVLRRSFVRSMAKLLALSPLLRSPSGSDSQDTSPTSSDSSGTVEPSAKVPEAEADETEA